jgi:hypothetical protein
MRQILSFLATEGSFLYETYRFHIIDSVFVPSFGGTGSVTLRNEVLELKFWLERDRLFMDLRSVNSTSSNAWFSTDILKQLLCGEICDKSLMDQANVAFLKENLPELQSRFAVSKAAATEATCHDLEKRRTKRLFG